MSLTFSLQKSASLSLLFMGTATLLFRLVPITPSAEQSMTQLHNVIPSSINSSFIAGVTSISTTNSSPNNPGAAEEVGTRIILGLVAAGAIGVVLSTRKNTKSSSSAYYSNSRLDPDSIRIEQANRKIQQKLLMLLHEDRETANRLLSQVKRKNPNRSIDWYIEKVIYDLERDRGSY